MISYQLFLHNETDTTTMILQRRTEGERENDKQSPREEEGEGVERYRDAERERNKRAVKRQVELGQ